MKALLARMCHVASLEVTHSPSHLATEDSRASPVKHDFHSITERVSSPVPTHAPLYCSDLSSRKDTSRL